jgi:putative Mg2+ transporter-C (MgtC) family protein
MDLHIGWQVIAIRLALTVVAGALLSVSMIQMNVLLQTNGKPADSYAVMDIMRLPLGILTGVGFIGAGAILRKNKLILGLTTAATLWLATVVGLCLGGGQLALGIAADVLGFIVLWGLRWFEGRIHPMQMGELRLTISSNELSAEELRKRLESAKIRIKSLSITDRLSDHLRRFECELLWPSPDGGSSTPEILNELHQLPGVMKIEWKELGPESPA